MSTTYLTVNQCLQLIGIATIPAAAIGGGIHVLGNKLPTFTPKRSLVVGAVGLLFAVVGSFGVLPDRGLRIPVWWNNADVDSTPDPVSRTSTSSPHVASSAAPAVHDTAAAMHDAAPVAPTPQAPPPKDREAWPSNVWIAALSVKPGESVPSPRPMPRQWSDNALGGLLAYDTRVAGSTWSIEERALGGKIVSATMFLNVGAREVLKNGHVEGIELSAVRDLCRGQAMNAFKERLRVDFGTALETSNVANVDFSKDVRWNDSCKLGWVRCSGVRKADIDSTIYPVTSTWRMEFRSDLISTDYSQLVQGADSAWDEGYNQYVCNWNLIFSEI